MILILGGTGEARSLAERLAVLGISFVSSLAGRVQNPRLPVGDVRVGGFGGVDGLADYLGAAGVEAVVDATHPFAARISANATRACARADVPLVRLARPGWAAEPTAGRWHWVDDHDAGGRLAASLGSRILLTTGRQHLADFLSPLGDSVVFARVVDPVDIDLPASWTVLRQRGPFDLDSERALMREHLIDVLVTKDSGGDLTRAKLDAADGLGVAVVVVRRPPTPTGVVSVGTVDDAVAWVLQRRAD